MTFSRRKKSDLKEVTNLTQKHEKVLFCKLSPLQRSAYLNVLESKLVSRARLRESSSSFKAISVLRKICNHPDFASRNGRFEFNDTKGDDGCDDRLSISGSICWNDSGKLSVLATILPAWKKSGDKVLIFSQTQSM